MAIIFMRIVNMNALRHRLLALTRFVIILLEFFVSGFQVGGLHLPVAGQLPGTRLGGL
jgi:kynureninase